MLSDVLRELAPLYYAEGDFTTAARVMEESLAEAHAIRSIFYVMLALFQLVIISCLQNDLAKAKGYCVELWALVRETGSPFAAMFAILTFGLVALFGGEPQRGVRLFAAFEVLLGQQLGMKLPESDPTSIVVRQALEKAQAQLGPAAFQAAWAEGQQMTLEQAIALATENEDED